MRRRGKQLAYGFLYFVFWGAVATALYFIYFKPAPSCLDGKQNQNEDGVDCGGVCGTLCLPADLRPITAVGQVKILFPDATHFSVLVKIQNGNAHLAARFAYRIRVYDTQDNFYDIPGSSLAYANEVKYIAAILRSSPPVFAGRPASRAEFLADSPQWISDTALSRPRLKILDQQVVRSGDILQVTGQVANEDTTVFPAATVVAVFFGEFGQVAGVSQTQLPAISLNATREFTIRHPALKGIDLPATQVFVYALQ